MPRLDISNTPEAERQRDVLVIGCGPAGSTISAMLAQKGRDVAVSDPTSCLAQMPTRHSGIGVGICGR